MDYYLDEFASRSTAVMYATGGLLFYGPIERALAADPHTYKALYQ